MFFKKKKRIFLDYASITPIAKEVALAMREAEEKTFANPSALYDEAIVAKDLMQNAREKISKILILHH